VHRSFIHWHIYGASNFILHLFAGPNGKMVSHHLHESAAGKFTVEYTPNLTGMWQLQHIIGLLL